MRKSSLLVAAALLVSLTACKKEQPPAPAPPPAAAPKPVKPVQAHVSSAQAAPSLDFTKKKDPFKPYVAEPPKPLPSMLRNRLPGGGDIPIQMYEVGQFKVIGLIAGLKENKAMVIDPVGKSYVLKEGMAIGKYGGRITSITGTYIEVREQYREDSGRVKTRTVRLTLPRKE